MEQEMTMQELIALMNDRDGEFIIHVEFREVTDGTENRNSE